MKDINIKKEDFVKVVAESYTKSEICKSFGLPENGRGYYWIAKWIKEYKCDISHFDLGRSRRKYNVIEKTCLLCGDKFEAMDGCRKRDGKCCSTKCANILRSGKTALNWNQDKRCLACDNNVKYHKRKFCSPECMGRYGRLKTFERIENGTFKYNAQSTSKNKQLKLYLIEKHGHKCMECGNTEWQGQPIPLQLDHKDGDSDNDDVKNIRNLCPNCHAQTPTYCGKNKGNGKRKYRLDDYGNGEKK